MKTELVFGVRSISVALYKEGKYWVAQAVDVDVSSFEETIDEARAAIREALELYFEDDGECNDANPIHQHLHPS